MEKGYRKKKEQELGFQRGSEVSDGVTSDVGWCPVQ